MSGDCGRIWIHQGDREPLQDSGRRGIGERPGFVRDKDNRLYINNTVFEAGMDGDCWQPIGDVF